MEKTNQDQYFKKGLSLYEQEDYLTAIEFFQAEIEIVPVMKLHTCICPSVIRTLEKNWNIEKLCIDYSLSIQTIKML